jgi:hypothetical protein
VAPDLLARWPHGRTDLRALDRADAELGLDAAGLGAVDATLAVA